MAFIKAKTANNESVGDFTHYAVFTYEDINDNAGASNQATIATIPAGGAVELVYVVEEEALVGATDITLDVGTSSDDPDEFIDALDVDGMTVPVFNTGDAFATPEEITGETASDTDILAEWGGTTGDLTAGKVGIYMRILNPSRFA